MVYELFKYILYFIGLVVVYFLYRYVVVPLYVRHKYSKYGNIWMSKKFVPLLGDFAEILEYSKENKFVLTSYKQLSLKKACDIRIYFLGDRPKFIMHSLESNKQFGELGK